ncbi:MAG: FkbM family methyltransferase [Fimbriimonadaceae bacterium]|nr:FkbM family methyltransferase [Fimbriimonadaceae bacterium]
MSIVSQLRRRVMWLVYLRRVGRRWAWTLASNDIWPLDSVTVSGDGALVVGGLGSTIPAPSSGALYLLRNVQMAIRLHQRHRAKYAFDERRVQVSLGNLQVVAYSEVDFRVIYEIFGEATYGMGSTGPMLVLDIGANIGMASLYFAERFGAEVRAFELVPSTAAIAAENFGLNPTLASQILLNSCGVSATNGSFDLPVNPDYRPSNSLFEPVPRAAISERVTVRDVAEVFTEAERDLASRTLVVKLDAEGAEYEIFERLIEVGKVGLPEIWHIEWHRRNGKDPDQIREALRTAGYHWFEREHGDAPVGYINAYRGGQGRSQ